MLSVILKIVSIIGIILLILLCAVLVILLLVLFMPIVYRADAEKSEDKLLANVKARWLFGFLRAGYSYPEPGNVVVKILWKTVFDSGNVAEKKNVDSACKEVPTDTEDEKVSDTKGTYSNESTEKIPEVNKESVSDENPEENKNQSLSEKLLAKYEKIKYTILQLYDKIKHIWENISFYKKLLENEQTKLLFSHVCKRIGKILRHIKPGKIKADVIFGADSPDTTGYVYGIYGMFSPQLGKDVCITPDFTQKILQGNIHIKGHITIFTILINSLAVLLDKRLKLFIRRVKAHSAKMAKT